MVAVFILVMGITAALGLASYSLNASTSIRKQMIGIGLAREGIEAVKNMRDTNWLNDHLRSDCYNFVDGSNNTSCYYDWLNHSFQNNYNIDPQGPSRSYILWFDGNEVNGGPYWHLDQENSRFGMDLGEENNLFGLYTHAAGPKTAAQATSDFSRKITIFKEDDIGPFTVEGTGARIRVLVQVTLETYLTNWKTYKYGEL